VWTASHRLPPTGHRGHGFLIWQEANGPRTPSARPILRGSEAPGAEPGVSGHRQLRR
jgi:hypothetical protein